MVDFLIFVLALFAAVMTWRFTNKKLQKVKAGIREVLCLCASAVALFVAVAILLPILKPGYMKEKEVAREAKAKADAEAAKKKAAEDEVAEAERQKKADEFRENRDLSDEAFMACQANVLDRLKAPASAKFPERYNVKRSPHQVYLIESYVDSQNSYGAMLRSGWRCRIHFDGGLPERATNWEAQDVKILES